MPHAKPIRLTAPYIMLGTEDVSCFARRIRIAGDEDEALATFCDPTGYSWVVAIDFLMSFGLDSLDEALTTIGPVGTIITFDFAYTADPASATNPHWTGECRLTAWPVVDAGINEPTEFTLEMPVIGEIVRDEATP